MFLLCIKKTQHNFVHHNQPGGLCALYILYTVALESKYTPSH